MRANQVRNIFCFVSKKICRSPTKVWMLHGVWWPKWKSARTMVFGHWLLWTNRVNNWSVLKMVSRIDYCNTYHTSLLCVCTRMPISRHIYVKMSNVFCVCLSESKVLIKGRGELIILSATKAPLKTLIYTTRWLNQLWVCARVLCLCSKLIC